MNATQPRNATSQKGFTVIELVIVIVLLGVVGSMAAVFMRRPIDAYFYAQRRAALTDVADTTLRRIARDLHKALPNSIRTNSPSCMEFIPTKTGGRYRTQDNQPGDSLDFTTNDTTFNMFGSNLASPPDQQIAVNDLIVVFNNLGPAGSYAYDVTNASSSKNWTTVSATPTVPGTYSPAETVIPIAAFQFPQKSNNNRFHVVPANEQMVSYVCSGSTLYRASNSVPTASPSCLTTTGGIATVSILANNVNCSGTSFTYATPDLQRNALVTMVLSLQDGSAAPNTENVSLQQEVHVDSTP